MFKYCTSLRSEHYDEVIDLYRNHQMSIRKIAKKTSVSKNTISRWLRNFADENCKDNTSMKHANSTENETSTSKTENELRCENERLRKELRKEKMRADLNEEIINVAEEKFKISIRKKARHQAINSLHAKDAKGYPVECLCVLSGVSKQAYYQYDGEALHRKLAQAALALQYINDVRKKDPGIGGKKLWYMYKRDFEDDSMGRDRFVDLVNEYGLKLRKRVRAPRTTDSSHGLPTYPNLITDFIPTAPNQLWVSDITYITLWPDNYTSKFCYLSVVLDAYSEEIVGLALGETLDTAYPVEALNMALKRIEGVENVNLIHHSDRGCQYASKEYVALLKAHGIKISMTESGNPKDNPQAERINNTIKNEFLKGIILIDIIMAHKIIWEAMDFYNNKRPHMSIGMMTPAEAASCTGEQKKMWVSYRERAIKKKADEAAITEESLPSTAQHAEEPSLSTLCSDKPSPVNKK